MGSWGPQLGRNGRQAGQSVLGPPCLGGLECWPGSGEVGGLSLLATSFLISVQCLDSGLGGLGPSCLGDSSCRPGLRGSCAETLSLCFQGGQ